MEPSDGHEQSSLPSTISGPRIFFFEFLKEFVSALAVLPILWLLALVLRLDMEKLEFVAAPVILAWFAARGWKTEEATWPRLLPIWRFIPKFLITTAVVIGLPLLLYSIVRGCILLMQSHDPPYSILGAATLVVIASCALLWFARNEAVVLGLRCLGLSNATTGQSARFAFYWLVSLTLIAVALRGEGPDFDRLCASARQAGGDLFGQITTSLDEKLYFGCAIKPQGDGYAVTIGVVPASEDKKAKAPIRFRVIVYPTGEVHHLDVLGGDPRVFEAR